MKKTFVIGDIHGCHSPLRRLLARTEAVPARDRFIFLGDYVNRGPNSKEVIDELIQLQGNFPDTIFLKGNHEVMLLDYLNGRGHDLFLSVGGLATLKSYGAGGEGPPFHSFHFPESHRLFLENLLPYWAEDDFIFVHAGLQPGVHLSQQDPHWLFWAERERFINTNFPPPERIVFAHFANRSPLIMQDKIGIDCGAVYGGQLTCLILPDMEFISEDSPRFWPHTQPERLFSP
ncbi:metallophosphoesterase family protein [Thiovibrio sp. JS02]